MSFSHVIVETLDPRAQRRREGIEGLSFSPLAKIFHRSQLHTPVEALLLQHLGLEGVGVAIDLKTTRNEQSRED